MQSQSTKTTIESNACCQAVVPLPTDKFYASKALNGSGVNRLLLCFIAIAIYLGSGRAVAQELIYPRSDVLSDPSIPVVPVGSPSGQTTGIVVGLPSPTPMPGNTSSVTIEPQVSLALPSNDGVGSWMVNRRPSTNLSGVETPFTFYQEPLPPPNTRVNQAEPVPLGASIIESPAEPIFDSIAWARPPRQSLFARRVTGQGMGVERLPFGLFDIDPAQPSNNFRIRGVFANHMHLPNRAGYFWSGTGGPSLGESVLDYQDLRLRMETGSKSFSTSFEIPFRRVDPVLNPNRTGLSDLQMATKLVMLSGENWIITQYMGFRFPTGNARLGLGAGKVGMEPGLLFRSKLREQTWLHSEVKFWFPLGALPAEKGEVLKIASGLNTVWRETDNSALVPSLELSSFFVTRGQVRDTSEFPRRINDHFILNLTPGVHYTVDRKGDFGLFDFGTAFSFATTTQRFADATFLLEARWFW